MRITAGRLKGRYLRVPTTGVRPSQDRLRQSLFSSLGEWVVGRRVLDLFAGSGALGLEAWSRGAREVVWIERDPRAFATLRANVHALCERRGCEALCLRGDATDLRRWGRQLGAFDLILADPPYDVARGNRLLMDFLDSLPKSGLVREDSVFVFEMRADFEIPSHPSWRPPHARRVGESLWILYRLRPLTTASPEAHKPQHIAGEEAREH